MNNSWQSDQKQIVVFALEEPRYALPLSTVERIIRAVEITPLQEFLNGMQRVVRSVEIMNLGGNVIPIFNMRRRFNLADREIALLDQFMIAQTTSKRS